jgi:hypothetical protein
MPGSTRHYWRIRRLLVVLCLLFAPPLDALDGDAEDVQLVAAGTEVASPEKRVPLADVPGGPVPPLLERPLVRPPTLTPPTRRPPITYLVRCRPSLRAWAGAGDADADPA